MIDVPLILTVLVIVSGLVVLSDILIFAKRRTSTQLPIVIDYARAFFVPLLVVLVVRSFIVQPYRVPTGSLEPTILPGDFIIVNQFVYGLKLPVINKTIYEVTKPKIGDIALFRYPPNPKVLYVKRVIGTPGDHVVYRNKILTINGKQASQRSIGTALDQGPIAVLVQVAVEQLLDVTHKIFTNRTVPAINFDIHVPQGHYFMMGDNRDNSVDSRMWGLVPEANLVGKVCAVWFSWDGVTNHVRWHRIGKLVH